MAVIAINPLDQTHSAPAATPRMSAGDRDEVDLIGDFELFAMRQTFTLGNLTLPAPVLIDLLDTVINREWEDCARRAAMRLAAAVAHWTYDAYLRERFGYEPVTGPEEAERVRQDARQVERHLILAASLGLDLGDEHLPRLAEGWLGIATSPATDAAYYTCIGSWKTVLKVVQQESPAMYLRVLVRKRVEDAERIRPARALGQSVLSLYENEDTPVAEFCDEAPTAFMDNLLERLRAKSGNKPARLVAIIQRVLDGAGKKELGRADYQYLYDNVPTLVRVVTRGDKAPVLPAPKGRHSGVSTQPWVRERVGNMHVAHRYRGQELEAYGALVRHELRKLQNTSAAWPVSASAK